MSRQLTAGLTVLATIIACHDSDAATGLARCDNEGVSPQSTLSPQETLFADAIAREVEARGASAVIAVAQDAGLELSASSEAVAACLGLPTIDLREACDTSTCDLEPYDLVIGMVSARETTMGIEVGLGVTSADPYGVEGVTHRYTGAESKGRQWQGRTVEWES